MREEAEPGVMPTYIFLVLGSGTVAMPVPDTEAMEADVNSMVTKNLQVSPGPVVLSTILDTNTGPSIPPQPRQLHLQCLQEMKLPPMSPVPQPSIDHFTKTWDHHRIGFPVQQDLMQHRFFFPGTSWNQAHPARDFITPSSLDHPFLQGSPWPPESFKVWIGV